MEFIEVHDLINNEIIGYEVRDDLGRTVYSEDNLKKRKIETEYNDNDGKSYRSKITTTTFFLNKRKEIETQRNIIKNDYLYGQEIPNTIINEKYNDLGGLSDLEVIHLKIEIGNDNQNTVIYCKSSDPEDARSIVFVVDNKNNLIEYINEFDDVHYSFIRKDRVEIRNEYNGINIKKSTAYYAFTYATYKYTIHQDGSMELEKAYHYNDGKLIYITDSNNKKIVKFSSVKLNTLSISKN